VIRRMTDQQLRTMLINEFNAITVRVCALERQTSEKIAELEILERRRGEIENYLNADTRQQIGDSCPSRE
jgi:uncharacterized membrane protein